MFAYKDRKYSLRKFKNGLASVAIAILLITGTSQIAKANSDECIPRPWGEVGHPAGEICGTTTDLPGLSGERSPLGGTTMDLPGLSGERNPLLGGTTTGLPGLSGERSPLLGGTTEGLPGLSGERIPLLGGTTEGLSGLSGERNPLLGGATEGLSGLSGERSPLGGTTEGLPGLSGERIPLLGGTTEGLSGLSGEGTPLLGDTTPGLLGLSGDRTLSIGSANQNQQSLMTTHQPRSNEYGSQSTSEKSTGGVKERDKNKENSSSELVSQTLQGSKDKKSYPRELMRVYPVALFLFLATITIISISYYNTKLEKKSEK